MQIIGAMFSLTSEMKFYTDSISDVIFFIVIIEFFFLSALTISLL